MAEHYITIIGAFSVELQPFLSPGNHRPLIRSYLVKLTQIFLTDADGAVYYLWNGAVNEKFSFQNLTDPDVNIYKEFTEYDIKYPEMNEVKSGYNEAD
jgi:hypothetical protein